MRLNCRPFILRHGFAAASVAATVVLRRWLDPWLQASFPFATIFFAILLTAWFGGLKPALTAIFLGGIAADYFLLEPRGSFALKQTELPGLVLYFLTGLGIAALGGAMDRARKLAETQTAALRSNNGRVEEQKAEILQKTQILESEVAARKAGEARIQLLETCINRLNDIVLITEAGPQQEADPRIIFVNDAFVRRTGYARGEAIGKSPCMLHGPKTDRTKLKRIREALAERKPVRVELINYTKTGGEFWLDLDIVPVADTRGCFTHWVAVERDIAERKLAEEQSARLAAIVQSSDDAIIGKNLEGIVTSWNLGAEALFGFKADEMVGQPILQIIPREHQHEEVEILAKVRLGESIQHFETLRRRKNGTTLEVSVTISPIKDPSGSIIGVSKIARDISQRRLAERTKLENEARLQLALQAAGMGTFEINLATGEAHWNIVEYELLGLKPGDSPPGPETFFRFVHPEDVAALREAWAKALRTGEYAAEFRVRHADGQERWLVGRGRFAPLVGDPSQPPSRFFGVNFDITERINAQQTARATSERMRLATEATAVGIWEWNIETDQIHWDDQMFRIYGIPPTPDGYVPYSSWSNCVMPDELSSQEQVMRETIRQLGHSCREFRIRRSSDGECRQIQAVDRVSLNQEGKAGWLVGTNLDVTERKRMEAELRESEERFRTMANSMSQLAWIAKADGYIFWYNQRWYDYTGTTPAQMEGWGWQSVHDPAVLPGVMVRWRNAIASGESFDMEFPLRGADGRFRTFLTRCLPLKDRDGRVVQWLGTNTDVDELKQAEEKIRQLNAELEHRVLERTAQLEAANRELEAFSYSVSHDLRAPLRAVNGFAEMVLSEFGGQLPEMGRHYLERIQKGGLRMGRLIDDLLSFSRLSRQPVKRQAVDANRLVQAALGESKTEQAGRPIEIRVENLPPCFGDPDLLRQVWINLIANAIKYTLGRTPAIIEIGAGRVNGEAVYFVKDNGAGFEMRFAHKLFGVFQRLHRSDQFEGTGVGLAIVQRIIHRHGGRVWAHAELDRGATFFFTLEQPKPT